MSWWKRPEAWMLVAYAVVLGLGLANHEMWRDELQAWLIAASSSSFGELMANLRYEGHPALWHLLLFFVSRLTQAPEAMQVLHGLIALASAYLVLRHAPFSRLQKGLIVFGYFPLFEFGMISRNYALGVLLTFAVCAIYAGRTRSYWQLAVLLALLCQTNAFGLLLALCLAAALVIEFLLDAEQRQAFAARWWNPALALLIVGGGVAVAVLQILPPADFHGTHAQISLGFDAERATRLIHAVGWSLLPWPDPTIHHFWNSDILASVYGGRKSLGIALALFLVALAALARRPYALGLFLAGAAGLLLVLTMPSYAGRMRYLGHLYVFFLACYWLARSPAGPGFRLPAAQWSPRRLGLAAPALTLVFALQAGAGLYAFAQDLRHPFSHSASVARYLRDAGLADRPILGSRDYVASPITAYLRRPIELIESDRRGTFIIWSNRRDQRQEENFARVASLVAREGEAVLVVNTVANPFAQRLAIDAAMPGFRVEPLVQFEQALVADENYRLYRVTPRLE